MMKLQKFINNVMCFLGVLLVLFSYSVQAKDPVVDKKQSVAEIISNVSKEYGAQWCQKRMIEMTNWAGANSEDAMGTMISFSGKKKTSDLLSAMVSTGGKTGLQMGFINVEQSKACSASGMLVRMWVEKCDLVVESVFKGYQPNEGIYGPGVHHFSAGEDEHLFTIDMTNGNKDADKGIAGCLTIVQSLVF